MLAFVECELFLIDNNSKLTDPHFHPFLRRSNVSVGVLSIFIVLLINKLLIFNLPSLPILDNNMATPAPAQGINLLYIKSR